MATGRVRKSRFDVLPEGVQTVCVEEAAATVQWVSTEKFDWENVTIATSQSGGSNGSYEMILEEKKRKALIKNFEYILRRDEQALISLAQPPPILPILPIPPPEVMRTSTAPTYKPASGNRNL